MKKRYAFAAIVSRCIDCKACMVACTAENNVPVQFHRNWVKWIGPKGKFPDVGLSFEPGNCNHCDNPPCERVCPTGATYKDEENGLVLIDYDKCIGCKYCMMACPYDARYFDEERGVVDKCTACIQRLQKGEQPACVATCIGGARYFGDLNDPESEISKLLAKNRTYVVYEDSGAGPAFYYIF